MDLKLLEEAQHRLRPFYFRLAQGDHALADDIAQETLLRSWRYLSVIEERMLRPLMCRVARNYVCNVVGKRRRETLVAPEKLDRPCSASCSLESAEESQRVRNAFASLPPEYQEVLLLRFDRDFSIEDTARALGMPSGTVKTRQHRGLARLGQALRDLQP